MMPMTGKPVGLWVAAGASALLATVLILEDRYGRVEAPEGPWPAARVAEANLLPTPVAVPAAESDTVERPLFVPSRRPPPPAPVAPPVRVAKDQFQLQGTIVVKGLDIALLKEKQSGKVVRVEKGALVSDMTLAEVYPDRVVLRAGEDSETLLLTVAVGPAVAPPTPGLGRPAAPRAPAAAASLPSAITPPSGAALPSAATPSPPTPSIPNLSPAAQEARREALRKLVTW